MGRSRIVQNEQGLDSSSFPASFDTECRIFMKYFCYESQQNVIHMKLFFVIILVVDSNEFTFAKQILNKLSVIHDLNKY